MKFTQLTFRCLVATAFLAASAGTALSYTQNQTCGGRGQPCRPNQEAHPIVWDRTCVLYYLDQTGSEDFEPGPDGFAGDDLERIVSDSFAAWTEPSCSGLKLLYGGKVDHNAELPGERRNTVRFNADDWRGSATTFATTIVNYNPNTGEIGEADIIVNDQFYEFSDRELPGVGEADLQNTLTHEVGHLIGMAHSDVAAATMFGSADLGETKKRSLHRDDIDGLCAHYPPEEYDSTCGMQDDEDDEPDDVIDGETGGDAFTWGEAPDSESACSVTGVHRSAIVPPILLILSYLSLIGGVLLWRRTGRWNDD